MAVMEGSVDLHTHTTASDGLHTPTEIVRFALEAGLKAVAITDHDTVGGIEEADAAGRLAGIEVVPGVELSTVAEGHDIHILAYYTSLRDERWLKRLESLRTVREQRNKLIIERLTQLGLPIMEEEVAEAAHRDMESRPAGATIGRPHIAAALVQKGYVGSVAEAFDRYLKAGASAYVNPPRLHPFEALQWIADAGGTSVIAHPGLYNNDKLVLELIARGAQGIEAYHSDHSAAEEQKYAEWGRKHRLIVTGGSDFHGTRQGQLFHGSVGNRMVSIAVLQQLRAGARS